MSGLELQRRLRDTGNELPIIIITGHGDVPSAVQALKNGAIDFIEKPFSDQQLLGRVRQALEQDRSRRETDDGEREFRRRFTHLTAREREVLAYVVAGYSSREIATALRLVVYTVENHRASIMRKLEVRSVADLVRKVTTSDLVSRLPKAEPLDPTSNPTKSAAPASDPPASAPTSDLSA